MTNDEAHPNPSDQPEPKLAPELAFFHRSSAGAIESSFISADSYEEGLAQVYLYRQVDLGYSIGAFLIDLTGAGIVDYFTNSSMTREHYEAALQENWHANDLVPMKPSQAAQVLKLGLGDSHASGSIPEGAAAVAAAFLGGLNAEEDDEVEAVAEDIIEVLSQLTPPPDRGPAPQEADKLSTKAVEEILRSIRLRGITGPEDPPLQ